MDVRQKDERGLTICPNCKKRYTPELPEREQNDRRAIQEIYPHSKPYQREQLLTGLCSDRCWKQYLRGSD